MDPDPTHTLVDPDLQNASKALDWSGSTKPKSNGHGWRKMGRFWTDPVHMLHKRKKARFHSFFQSVSLSSSLAPFSLLLQTLTLTISIPDWIRSFTAQSTRTTVLNTNHAKESGLYRWNDVISWILMIQVRTVRILCFFGWNRCKTVRIRSDSHSLWIRKRFFDFF